MSAIRPFRGVGLVAMNRFCPNLHSVQGFMQRGTTHAVCRNTSSSTAGSDGTDLSQYGTVLGGEKICPKALKTFEVWHQCVSAAINAENQSADAKTVMVQTLSKQVDEKCRFYPPTYFKHWEGKDEFLVLISSVSEVFGPSFTYGRQWLSPNGRDWALEFSADIEETGKKLDGIDLVSLDEEGKIVKFTVLARPPNAVDALKQAMMRKVPPRLAKLKAQQVWGAIFG